MQARISIGWIAALTVAAAGTAYSQSASSPLDGEYVIDLQRSDDIDKALEEVFLEESGPGQMDARNFFRKRHPTYARVSITHQEGNAVVTFDSGNPMRMPVDGTTVAWTREDGKKLQIKCECGSNRLVQTIDTRDTLRVNDFALDADGRTLVMNVTFTGYPKPLAYRLNFNRKTTP